MVGLRLILILLLLFLFWYCPVLLRAYVLLLEQKKYKVYFTKIMSLLFLFINDLDCTKSYYISYLELISNIPCVLPSFETNLIKTYIQDVILLLFLLCKIAPWSTVSQHQSQAVETSVPYVPQSSRRPWEAGSSHCFSLPACY